MSNQLGVFIGQARREETSTRYKFRSYNKIDKMYGNEEGIKQSMSDIEKEYYDLSKKIYETLAPIEFSLQGNKELELDFYYTITELNPKT